MFLRLHRFLHHLRIQVVHAEAYYSRKDDVPERPHVFAGKVFRILHKDDLQVTRARQGGDEPQSLGFVTRIAVESRTVKPVALQHNANFFQKCMIQGVPSTLKR